MEVQTVITKGRLTMIKSTLTSIPNCTFSCFKAPGYVCNKIDQTLRSFWWGHELGERRIHLRNWETICQSKTKKGLGIRKTELMNITLLGKQAWRIITEPKTLMASTLLPKY